MQQAALMQYDDDFDEEQVFCNSRGVKKNKYAVEIIDNR